MIEAHLGEDFRKRKAQFIHGKKLFVLEKLIKLWLFYHGFPLRAVKYTT